MTDDIIDYKYLIKTQSADPSQKFIFLFLYIEKDAYLSWLETHNRRPETIRSYRAQLDAIQPYVLNTLGWFRFDEIGTDEIMALMESLTVSERSKKDYLDTFGRLVQFVTGKNPVKEAQILWNNSEPMRRVFIDNEDWPKIKAAAKSTTDKVILGLGAYLGMRREEMVRIRMDDLDDPLNPSIIRIHGKGHGKDGAESLKEIPAPLKVILKRYLQERAALRLDHDLFLIRTDGRQKGKIMNGRSIRFAVDRMTERSGVKFTPHSLRRLYATTMWEASGHDLETTRRATRHKSVDVLMNCYIQPNPERLKKAQDRLCEML